MVRAFYCDGLQGESLFYYHRSLSQSIQNRVVTNFNRIRVKDIKAVKQGGHSNVPLGTY